MMNIEERVVATWDWDYDLLAEVIDVFSPMVYHGRMERSPDWVGENVIWLGDRLKTKKIWPIVQAYNDPHQISAAEFEQVLRGGLSGKIQVRVDDVYPPMR